MASQLSPIFLLGCLKDNGRLIRSANGRGNSRRSGPSAAASTIALVIVARRRRAADCAVREDGSVRPTLFPGFAAAPAAHGALSFSSFTRAMLKLHCKLLDSLQLGLCNLNYIILNRTISPLHWWSVRTSSGCFKCKY